MVVIESFVIIGATLILALTKVIGILHWNWLFVFCPVLIPIAIAVIIFCLAFCAEVITNIIKAIKE